MKSRRLEVVGVILLIVGFVLAVAGIAMLFQRNVFKIRCDRRNSSGSKDAGQLGVL